VGCELSSVSKGVELDDPADTTAWFKVTDATG
jgi:hypothetical protein